MNEEERERDPPSLNLWRTGAGSSDVALEQSADASGSHWSPVTAAPNLDLTNLQYELPVSTDLGSNYFRLGPRH